MRKNHTANGVKTEANPLLALRRTAWIGSVSDVSDLLLEAMGARHDIPTAKRLMTALEMLTSGRAAYVSVGGTELTLWRWASDQVVLMQGYGGRQE